MIGGVPRGEPFLSLAVAMGEADQASTFRYSEGIHRWRWGYRLRTLDDPGYLVIGVARSCGRSAGETEAVMRSGGSDRLYLARAAGGNRYYPLPKPGRYVACYFIQRQPDDPVALLASQTRFDIPDGYDPPALFFQSPAGRADASTHSSDLQQLGQVRHKRREWREVWPVTRQSENP
jgi:hypothetical protein